MIESFSVAFISIVLEAMPFVLLGTLISSLIEVYVSNEWVSKQFEKGAWYHVFLAGLMGLVFPVCECAIVPIMRRLIKKGIPKGIAITFMLAVPIVNPMVLFSTYYAFNGDLRFLMGRAVLGYLGAVLIGLIMEKWVGKKQITINDHDHSPTCSCHHHEGTCDHDHSHDNHSLKSRFLEIVGHTAEEFMDVGRFLILGAFIAATMQTFVPREMIGMVSNHKVLSILVMMLMAFVLSLCSEADAFIASTFRSSFSEASILAFLIFGPMIDIKNTVMLSAQFKPGFVIRLIGVITGVCLLLALIAGMVL